MGCGGGTTCSPVRGSVQVDGKPAEGVLVVLHPLSDDQEVARLRPSATTVSGGSFQITCFESGDGAPPGEYSVTIEWRKEIDDPRTGKSDLGPDILRGRYADAKTTELSVTITAGDNDLPPFQLQSK